MPDLESKSSKVQTSATAEIFVDQNSSGVLALAFFPSPFLFCTPRPLHPTRPCAFPLHAVRQRTGLMTKAPRCQLILFLPDLPSSRRAASVLSRLLARAHGTRDGAGIFRDAHGGLEPNRSHSRRAISRRQRKTMRQRDYRDPCGQQLWPVGCHAS